MGLHLPIIIGSDFFKRAARRKKRGEMGFFASSVAVYASSVYASSVGCLWLSMAVFYASVCASSVRPLCVRLWLSSVGEDGRAAIVIMDVTTL